MTLIASAGAGNALPHVPELPIVGRIPYGSGDCRYRLVAG